MKSPNDGRYAVDQDYAPGADEVPPDIAAIPDAVPREEPRARSGNSPVYEVFGKTYRVLDDGAGFTERGTASWYGKKFHGHATASGEPYDMFKMSAAHKTLPIPSYVRVTRRDTGRSVIVRINDRGPFHSGRIIDLSYAAAAKLDMLSRGSAPVEIVALQPVPAEPTRLASRAKPRPATGATAGHIAGARSTTPPAAPAASGYWIQVAAYVDPRNAAAMRARLNLHDIEPVQVIRSEENGQTLHRIQIGPFADRQTAESVRSRLLHIGLGGIIKSGQGS